MTRDAPCVRVGTAEGVSRRDAPGKQQRAPARQEAAALPSSTLTDTPLPRARRARAGRRLAMGAVAALIVAGLVGLTGNTRATVRARDDGYVLSVEYARRTRGGMPADLRVTVVREGGFDGPVQVAVTTEYLRLFDQHGIVPEPVSGTADERWARLEFAPPPGDTLTVRYGARVSPGTHFGQTGTVAVLEDGRPVVSVDVETIVVP